MTDRYQVSGVEGEFQPGSNESVRCNLVGITSEDEMQELELHLLSELYEEVLFDHFPDRTLTVADLKEWHRLWLGNVYPWAGEERSVNLGKGGFQFASAALLPSLLANFEPRYLAGRTPCSGLDDQQLIATIAEAHVEFILIHPFREGNGRISRLLADVMAVQAGRAPLDYTVWESHKEAYIGAIHAGMCGNYAPMCQLVKSAMGQEASIPPG